MMPLKNQNEMNTSLQFFKCLQSVLVVTITGILISMLSCAKSPDNAVQPPAHNETSGSGETIWHVKAFLPEGKLLDVKALDKDGNIYAVKAIQRDDNFHMMDIKALVGDKKLPVKMLVSDDQYAPVKAIGEDGTIYDIKALTAEG